MSYLIKLGLSAVVAIGFFPGLIIEPGPLSEATALAAWGSIWGFDLLEGGGD